MCAPVQFTTSVADLSLHLRSVLFAPPFPSLGDRTAWHAVRSRLGDATVTALLAQAEADAARPIGPLPATLWLDFARTGRRENYEDPASERRRQLWTLTLGENGVLIQGNHGKIRIGFDPAVVDVRLEEHVVEFEPGPLTVQRIVFVVQAVVRAGLVRLEIVPV